jgi:two-component system, chemotaxis family, sensor kinase CheA
MSVQLAQYRDLYFSEAHEQLANIAAALRKLERAPGERAHLDAAFRSVHTLKGMSATMGYDEIAVFAHAFEDLLQSVRGRSDGISNGNIYPLFRTLDHLNRIVRGLESGNSPDADALAAHEATAPAGIARSTGGASTSIHIRSEQLDRLMTRMTGLLASAIRLPNAAPDSGEETEDSEWRKHLTNIKQLQADMWSLRMAPIGEAFNRFPPMLHELARSQGKEIRVRMEGAEIEVGRRIVEELGEPLLHLLRNAVTHGIEPLPERLRSGKDPRGTVMLHACSQGDSIVLEVRDDGRGLDARLILQAAHEQAFISERQLNTMSESEACELIMLSGFSMSPAVTNASGRGVGLDIVRSKINALHGTIHTRSRPGNGTTFVLQLPLILGAIQVELVRVGDQILAIPAAQIESRRVWAQDDLTASRSGETKLEGLPSHPIDLRPLYHIPPRPASDSSMQVIVTHKAVAIRVDEFLGRTLWSEPPIGGTPAVPLLDPDQLPPA